MRVYLYTVIQLHQHQQSKPAGMIVGKRDAPSGFQGYAEDSKSQSMYNARDTAVIENRPAP